MLLNKVAGIISRPIILGLLSVTMLSGVYVKGRIDGYHKAEIQVIQNENKDLKDALTDFKDDITKDVERIIEETRTFAELSNTLNDRTEEIIDALPKDDASCNFPAGSANRLRNSLQDANAAVFGNTPNGPPSPRIAPRRD